MRPCSLSVAISAKFRGDAKPAKKFHLAPIALLVMCAPLATFANNYTVTATGDPGTGGLSLRQAVALANTNPGSTIDFDPSLFGSTITLTQGQIAISKSMSIIGPGADKLTISGGGGNLLYTNYDQSSPPVTISGLTLANSDTAIGAASTSIVLQNSVVSGNVTGIAASASKTTPASINVTNTIFENNVETKVGGSGLELVFAGISAQIDDCIFRNNTGPAVYVNSVTSLSVSNSKIYGNSASATAVGGGIFAKYSSNVSVSASTINGNTSTKGGAGIYIQDVLTASIANTVISGNTSGGDGGAILVNDKTGSNPYTQLSISRSTISDNGGYYTGAIDIKRAFTVTMQQSLVSGNAPTYPFDGVGGGIDLEFVSGFALIENSTFYNNFAYDKGGAIAVTNAATGNSTSILSTTIFGNHTEFYYGNGISALGVPAIDNSIIANNSSRMNTQDLEGGFAINHSLVTNPGTATLTGTGNINVDPQLGPLTFNDGPTLTMLPSATSPVVNTGDPAILSGTDQRGLPRVVSGRADMGAVERQTSEDIIFRNGFESS